MAKPGQTTVFFWLARSASALFRIGSKKRIGDRPTDTARHGPTRHPSLLIWDLTIFDEIPFFKINKFRRKFVKLGRIPYFKTDNFRRKFVKLGRTPYFKTDNFRRNFLKLGGFFFDNGGLRPKLLHMRFARATVAGPPGSNRPATLFM